jgi:predicted DNA-binding protein
MGDSLAKYVKETMEWVIWSKVEEEKAARFSVSIDALMNRRLEAIAERLGIKKTELVRNAISCMVYEFEDKLGLSLDPVECSDYFLEIFPPSSVGSATRVYETSLGPVEVTERGCGVTKNV